ncbi:MAG TPA: hypothetical protein VFF07_16935, partial [Actinomycetota bacterium]|nr:hypothetical protein [Actinomycetota bacterium]
MSSDLTGDGVWANSEVQPRPIFDDEGAFGRDWTPLLRIARLAGLSLLALAAVTYVVVAFWPRDNELIHFPPESPADVLNTVGEGIGEVGRRVKELAPEVAGNFIKHAINQVPLGRQIIAVAKDLPVVGEAIEVVEDVPGVPELDEPPGNPNG